MGVCEKRTIYGEYKFLSLRSFPLSRFFIGLKTRTEITLGRREINQVFIGRDGYLIEKYQKPVNTEQISRTLKTFGEKEELTGKRVSSNVSAYCYLYLQKQASQFAPAADQMETAEKIYQDSGLLSIDCSQDLLAHQQDGQLYYRTDHHWTTYGAYVGYLAFCREKGLVPVSLDELEAETAAEDFCGTIYSKVNDYSQKGDKITIYRNPADKLTVYYEDTKETTDSLYNLKYARKKDKYSLFLDNLHPLIEITNENAESEKSWF